jgi:succinoglycan biosynthesis protein ExoV
MIIFDASDGNQKKNFGDELNFWLWPKLFKDFDNSHKNSYFLGIGSMLDNMFLQNADIKDAKKIIFGSGMRKPQSLARLNIDSCWDIHFLRGPLSAYALAGKYEYISDAAYTMMQTKEFDALLNMEKKYEISVIPHFSSLQYFDWEQICATLNYHFISPIINKYEVDHILKEIASSRKVIAEAMHGAIVADILRVPWHRFILAAYSWESELVSEFKWMDWQCSINLSDSEASKINFFIGKRWNEFIKSQLNNIRKDKYKLRSEIYLDIISELRSIHHFYLSNDHVIREIDERLTLKLEQFLLQYRK